MIECFASVDPELSRVRAGLSAMALGQPGLVGRLARHALQNQGQMLRPSLLLISSLGGGLARPPDQAIDLGTMVELVHAASLLHDDVVDAGRFRRQATTINAQWGNKEAVLLGDFLLARSLEILARFPDRRILGSMHRITLTLSTGELLELENSANLDMTEEAYLSIIALKTAAFFAECCHLGGIVGRVRPNLVEKLTAYGEAIGIVYQILDDLLDVMGSEERLGKDTVHDVLNGQITLPIIHALGPASSRRAREELRAAFARADAAYLRTNLARIVREVGTYDYCVGRARVFVNKATSAIVRPRGARTRVLFEALDRFTGYIFNRLESFVTGASERGAATEARQGTGAGARVQTAPARAAR